MKYLFLTLFAAFFALSAASAQNVKHWGRNEVGSNKRPKLFILTVGISDYQHEGVRDLHFAEKDAKDVSAAFGAQTDLYDIRANEILVGSQATRLNILSKLAEIHDLMTENDLLLFLFSGHGSSEKFLLPYDFNPNVTASGLAHKDLTEQLKKFGNQVVLLDACFSAAVINGGKGGYVKDEAPTIEATVNDLNTELAEPNKTKLLYASSASNQVSFECETCQNGYFAQTILDALTNTPILDVDGEKLYADTDKDGFLSIREFEDFIKDGTEIRTILARKTNTAIIVQRVKGRVEAGSGRMRIFKVMREETPPPPPDNMVFVQGGTFTMGDVKNDNESSAETQHSVTVSDFYISKYETTFGEYDMFCNATGRAKPDDSGFGRGSRPVINVSWHDAVAYCDWKTQQTGKKYRLPTEAEWEFAARGRGANIRFGNNSDNINDQNANFDARANYKKDYSSAGTYRAATVAVTDMPSAENALGLRHMSGNVWEWCSDWYGSDYYKNSRQYDPQGAATGSDRVLRGGGWSDSPQYCRAANRAISSPDSRGRLIGFRLVSQ